MKKQKVGFSLDQYNLLDDIYEFLERIQSEHPDRATIINIGESYEGRPLKVIKISTNENNPVIFIEANIHAREWISSATALWTINELLTTTNATVKAITDSVTWYILPVTNPDGYQFTHDEYRLWRKTRSIHNIFCRGVDPNRNFGYNFRSLYIEEFGFTSTSHESFIFSGWVVANGLHRYVYGSRSVQRKRNQSRHGLLRNNRQQIGRLYLIPLSR